MGASLYFANAMFICLRVENPHIKFSVASAFFFLFFFTFFEHIIESAKRTPMRTMILERPSLDFTFRLLYPKPLIGTSSVVGCSSIFDTHSNLCYEADINF